MKLACAEVQKFRQEVNNYYAQHGRHDLPWRQPESRGGFDPYKILVSELMLQQTQVNRVIPKYHEFLQAFPDVNNLTAAPLGEVITVWSGLGYNRRAKYLHEAARQISKLGSFPNTITELVKLPGVGKNTAGAIVAYAYNQPEVFVETNIRTVYIHHFLMHTPGISDSQITGLVEATLCKTHPREWYWALMDYGSYLKREIGNLNKLSKVYSKQSAFIGSKRQLRGKVLRELAHKPRHLSEFTIDDYWLPEILETLVTEGLIRCSEGVYRL